MEKRQVRKNMKPIVSFDVDMTLLDHKDWTIPDSAMETLERLRENYTIVLATGRDMDSSFSVVLKRTDQAGCHHSFEWNEDYGGGHDYLRASV